VASRLRLESSATGPAPWTKVITELVLYADLPYAELEFTVVGKRPDPWPEAGWLCLPFNVEAPQFRLGRLGGLVDPARDIVPGANRNLYGLHTGVALFDPQGSGVGLCALDNPLVSLDEPGCWKYSLDFVPKKPVVYVNLFNNQWTTNFRLWNRGTWTARVRLWSFDKFDADSGLITPALEARYPLLAAVANGAAGKLPPSQPGVEVSSRGALVTAFGANPDGPGILLRLWEHAGRGGLCRVQLPGVLNATRAQPCDLRGQAKGEPLPIRHGVFETKLTAFAPAGFLLLSAAPN
jgi:hypothetical protein